MTFSSYLGLAVFLILPGPVVTAANDTTKVDVESLVHIRVSPDGIVFARDAKQAEEMRDNTPDNGLVIACRKMQALITKTESALEIRCSDAICFSRVGDFQAKAELLTINTASNVVQLQGTKRPVICYSGKLESSVEARKIRFDMNRVLIRVEDAINPDDEGAKRRGYQRGNYAAD